MRFTKVMNRNILFIALAATLISFDLPTGWFKAGSKPKSYEMSVDKGSGHDGKNAVTIRSIEEKIDGFGTVMQKSPADNYLGKRVRMSGYLKTKNVEGWAGLWLRVDQKGLSHPAGFDNMRNGKQDRSVRGNRSWKKYEIVLDVPSGATALAYGALIHGTGQIWFDDIRFEITDSSSATTGRDWEEYQGPANLDFEK